MAVTYFNSKAGPDSADQQTFDHRHSTYLNCFPSQALIPDPPSTDLSDLKEPARQSLGDSWSLAGLANRPDYC